MQFTDDPGWDEGQETILDDCRCSTQINHRCWFDNLAKRQFLSWSMSHHSPALLRSNPQIWSHLRVKHRYKKPNLIYSYRSWTDSVIAGITADSCWFFPSFDVHTHTHTLSESLLLCLRKCMAQRAKASITLNELDALFSHGWTSVQCNNECIVLQLLHAQNVSNIYIYID